MSPHHGGCFLDDALGRSAAIQKLASEAQGIGLLSRIFLKLVGVHVVSRKLVVKTNVLVLTQYEQG